MNGQMNMNYPNQFPPNNGMMNNMPQQMPQPIDPKAAEKKAKAKGRIKKLILFIVIFVIMFFGKRYIDFVTLDYKPIVDEAMYAYYMTGDSQKLEPIKDLLIKYKKNTSIVKKIQNYSYEKVGEWFIYIDDKYTCDKTNANSCRVQLSEFRYLVQKLDLLYQIKGGGYYLIPVNGYSALKSEGEKKIENLTAVTNNRTYTSPDNSESIYQAKCKSATDCDCRDGICSCKYKVKGSGGDVLKDIKCYKPETIQEK